MDRHKAVPFLPGGKGGPAIAGLLFSKFAAY